VNSARINIERDGQETQTVKETVLHGDEYARLATPGGIHATVGFNVGTQHDYGKAKIMAIVTLVCDQNTATLDRAAELALLKAVEYANEGMRILVETR
jgi:hypothetical protein